MTKEQYDNFHNLCEKLTGDKWCPYPSDLMVQACAKVDAKTATKLILERRKHYFPEFLAGEPMQKMLEEALI